MKKIVFGITDLSIGGAEKTLVEICNKLCDKYKITIFTLYNNGILEKYFNPNIEIVSLHKKAYKDVKNINRKFIFLKLLLFKKYIYNKYLKKQFDVEIAFLEGLISILFSVKNKKIKKIAWIHTDISLFFGKGLKSKIKKLINNKIYKNYNEIICVSKRALKIFEKTHNIPVKKDVIYNYINVDNILTKSNEKIDFEFDNTVPNFLSVSRLDKPKAIDRLIRVHSKLIKNGFYNKIYIIGDGPEKNNLKKLICDLNVEKTFILLGQKENPYAYIKKCKYFCLTSYHEGYGNVIEEAKVLAKFVITTDTAAVEALENYSNKIIIPNNENSLYEELKKIIIEPPSLKEEEKYVSNKSIERIIEKIEEINF